MKLQMEERLHRLCTAGGLDWLWQGRGAQTQRGGVSLGVLKREEWMKGICQRGIWCSTHASWVLATVIIFISPRFHPSPPIPIWIEGTEESPLDQREHWVCINQHVSQMGSVIGGGDYMDYSARTGLRGVKDTCGISPSRKTRRKRKRGKRQPVDENWLKFTLWHVWSFKWASSRLQPKKTQFKSEKGQPDLVLSVLSLQHNPAS